jgi:hypothetical protein
MDASFLEKIPFFTKNSLQGKKIREENFWETSKPLPKTITDNLPLLQNPETLLSLPTDFEHKLEDNTQGDTNSSGKESSVPTGVEILQETNKIPELETLVYSRK